MPTFYCSTVLFDLDGVLVDSTRAIINLWTRWAKENGLDPEDVLPLVHGRRSIEVLRIVAPHLDIEAEVRKLERRITEDDKSALPVPGAAAVLAALPHHRWGVVTSGVSHLAKDRLRLAGLPAPPVLVAADDVTQGKPHPEPYLKGAKLLGADPKQCLVIEDAPAGIRAAHAGGMKVIGVVSTYPASELAEADAVIQDLTQLQIHSAADSPLLEVAVAA
jgi:sugar-phosphatase